MAGFYYNKSFRKYIAIMMDMFSKIKIEREDTNGEGDVTGYKYIPVPVTYASKEQFVARLFSQDKDTTRARIETVLPRMSLNLIDIVYDPSRKTSVMNRESKMVTRNKNKLLAVQYNPVPYDLIFEMGIYTRYQDDIFQIIEQMLPNFQPNFETHIIELDENDVTIDDRKISVIIETIAPSEDVENQAGVRRHIEWTLQFRLKGWIYPSSSTNSGIIKTIYLNFGEKETEVKTIHAPREQVSTVLGISYNIRRQIEQYH